MNVLNFSDPASLNLNPLYKVTNATFIKGYKQLVLALNEQRNQTSVLSVEQFFNLERMDGWTHFEAMFKHFLITASQFPFTSIFLPFPFIFTLGS